MENGENWLVNVTRGTFHNDYILGDVIGRGSLSTVHSCLHKGRKKYACKIVLKIRLNKTEARKRVEILLKLRHDNIVTVRDVYNDSLSLYIVEDLAFGGELLERLASCGGYSEKDAATAVRDALAALEYIHGMKLSHGSVRPEKLLYATNDKNSRLLLTDMGLGTGVPNRYNILYCAPEVLNTPTSSPAADIWSLGVVIYIMLCGFEPFWESQEFFPSPYWDDKSEAAKLLITQLMQRLPASRPTAQDLLKDSWVRGEKTAEHSMTETVKHLREFNARRKFKVATLVVRATHRAMALSHYHEGMI